MHYVSTRPGQGGDARSFSEILLDGLAPGGGLYVPASFPKPDIASWRGLSYPELAARVLGQLGPEIDWEPIAAKTYTAAAFGSEEIVPVSALSPLGDLHLVHLSNGPTLAFKDIALQLLGNLFEEALRREGRTMTVLGATSGDTGSAAEAALAGKRNVRVVMLSPLGRTSPFQAAQMYSLPDPNIHNLAVRGVFDDCQDIVKALSSDEEFKEKHALGAVNSINWARIAAQAVYYFWAALRFDCAVDFSVPSGNFGNVYAGWLARKMGAPIRRLLVATNENDVLAEFFQAGVYRPRPASDVLETDSPSMDISKASNVERLIFEVVGRDPERVKTLFGSAEFSLPQKSLQSEGLIGHRTTHSERVAAMRRVWDTCGRILDPHTAAGVVAAEVHKAPGVPMLCLETALPCKFEAAVYEALGVAPPRPDRFIGLESRPQHVMEIEGSADAVRDYIDRLERDFA